MNLRHQRLHLRHIARLLAAPYATVARALNRLGLGRLRSLDPKPPVMRYEQEHPKPLISLRFSRCCGYSSFLCCKQISSWLERFFLGFFSLFNTCSSTFILFPTFSLYNRVNDSQN